MTISVETTPATTPALPAKLPIIVLSLGAGLGFLADRLFDATGLTND